MQIPVVPRLDYRGLDVVLDDLERLNRVFLWGVWLVEFNDIAGCYRSGVRDACEVGAFTLLTHVYP